MTANDGRVFHPTLVDQIVSCNHRVAAAFAVCAAWIPLVEELPEQSATAADA